MISATRFVVRMSYRMEESRRYRRFKGFFYDLLESPESRIKPIFDAFMIVVVLLSVFMLIYAVQNETGTFGDIFERVVITIFVTEYLLRMWVYSENHLVVIRHHELSEIANTPFRLGPAIREILRRKWEYMKTPLAIIDLLAILPSYRPLRMLRIFLLFRLLKLFRYSRSINEFVKVISEKRFEFYTLAIFLGFTVFAASSAIFVFEGDVNPKIDDFFDAVYWSLITISTVGYGDITPASPEGRFVTLILIVAGVGVIAFSTSIVVAAFSDKLQSMRQNRVFAATEKKTNLTIVCGYGRVGQEVADHLAAVIESLIIIDKDESQVELAKRRGLLAIQGDAASDELLLNLGIRDRASRILCLTASDVSNVYITLTARHLNPTIEIISRASRKRSSYKLLQAGANHIVTPFSVVGLMAAEYVGQPVAFEAIYGILVGERDIGIDAIVVPEDAALAGQALQAISFADQSLILFGVIRNEVSASDERTRRYRFRERHFIFNPDPELVLQGGDILVVFGHEFSMSRFRDRLETDTLQLVTTV